MKDYYVRIPMAGIVGVSVSAVDEETAIDVAKKTATNDNFDEWDVYDNIVKGNVLYAPLNEIEIEEE